MFFFFKQKTAYEMRISDWSSDVCSSDLGHAVQRTNEEAVAGVGRHPVGLLGVGDVHEAVAAGQHRQREGLGQELGVGIVEAHQIGRAAWRERVCQYV